MNDPEEVKAIRDQLMGRGLLEADIVDNPIDLFKEWLTVAQDLGFYNAEAMVVSTVSDNAVPSMRNVLMRGLSTNGLIFYTNYLSQKGRELDANPFAASIFSWLPLERQVRFSGSVAKTSVDISDNYFQRRARESRISAIISKQSEVVTGRGELELLWTNLFNELDGADVSRPVYWGGYQLIPNRIEFWQGRANRLHDRLVYEKSPEGWAVSRLAP
ncbi:MAG: pyridoxamine 5'-phosphate oxidase [Candidatus Poriferisodalaceae bacterium]|jgi:pyridoxamine 5'-phosphate oxidase|tara:strand:- start:14232 stop:14879 length:648 start_codon:yes stop_codon:yes gene_type:complete